MSDFLTTSDGQKISYTYFEGSDWTKAAILLHQRKRDRHTFDSFAKKLAGLGFNVISVDLRGHGESSKKLEELTEQDYKSMVLEVKAAKGLLRQKGVDTSKLLLIGASIGANTAINYAAKDKDVKAIIALSPGLNYYGIDTMKGIGTVPEATLLVASEGDEISARGVRRLAEQNSAVEVKIYPVEEQGEGDDHGTGLFQTVEGFDNYLIDWIKSKY